MERPLYSQVHVFLMLKKVFPDYRDKDLEMCSYYINRAINGYNLDFHYNEVGAKDLRRIFYRKRNEIKGIIDLLSTDKANNESLTPYSYMRRGAEKLFQMPDANHLHGWRHINFIENIKEDLETLIKVLDYGEEEIKNDAKRGRKENDTRLSLANEIGCALFDLTGEKPTTSQNGIFYKLVKYAFKTTQTELENIHHILAKVLKD